MYLYVNGDYDGDDDGDGDVGVDGDGDGDGGGNTPPSGRLFVDYACQGSYIPRIQVDWSPLSESH